MTIEDKVNILINDLNISQETRKQNFSSLAKSDGTKIISYCALGALGCVKRLLWFNEKEGHIMLPEYNKIIEAYGISNLFTKSVITPILYHRSEKDTIQTGKYYAVADLIVSCNDGGHYSFKEIGNYFRVLLEESYFKECDRKTELNALKTQRKLTEDEIIQKYKDMPDMA